MAFLTGIEDAATNRVASFARTIYGNENIVLMSQ